MKENLDFYSSVTSVTILSLKTDVNVPAKVNNKQKKFLTKCKEYKEEFGEKLRASEKLRNPLWPPLDLYICVPPYTKAQSILRDSSLQMPCKYLYGVQYSK